jgi:uncharacterized protein YegJ (DUF2314 family)
MINRGLLTILCLLSPATALLGSLAGCGSSGFSDVEHQVIKFDDKDEEMNAAMATAKKTLGTFEKNWKKDSADTASLKFAMPTRAGGIEHIWFTPIEIKGDKVTGQCANDPQDIEGLKYGDVRTVNRSDISDWMILRDDKCYGGYTVRVMAKRYPESAPPDMKFADF